MTTAKRKLIELLYPGDVYEQVKAMLSEGASWRTIAEHLTSKTGQGVSHETVRAWYQNGKSKQAKKMHGRETFVYALKNKSAEVIYIGMSVDPASRLACHKGSSWGDEIESLEILGSYDWETAEEVEHDLIFKHKPPYNKASVDGRKGHEMAREAWAETRRKKRSA